MLVTNVQGACDMDLVIFVTYTWYMLSFKRQVTRKASAHVPETYNGIISFHCNHVRLRNYRERYTQT